jgi:WD40 repeat protein
VRKQNWCVFSSKMAFVNLIKLIANHPYALHSCVKNSVSYILSFYLVWNFETGKCRRTFRHRHVVLSVDVSDVLVVSGCEGWKVKVWDIESATLVKVDCINTCIIS